MPDVVLLCAWCVQDFLYVVIPVVSTFGPLGALLSSYFHRLVHATVVYVMDIAQFIGKRHAQSLSRTLH